MNNTMNWALCGRHGNFLGDFFPPLSLWAKIDQFSCGQQRELEEAKCNACFFTTLTLTLSTPRSTVHLCAFFQWSVVQLCLHTLTRVPLFPIQFYRHRNALSLAQTTLGIKMSSIPPPPPPPYRLIGTNYRFFSPFPLPWLGFYHFSGVEG